MLSSGEGSLYPIRNPEELNVSEEADLTEEELANVFKVMGLR